MRGDQPRSAGHDDTARRCVRGQVFPDLAGQPGGLGCAEPGKQPGYARGGALVLERVVHVPADEHRLVHPREVDAAEPRAGQQRARCARVGEGESSRRPGQLAQAEGRRGRREPDGKEGVLVTAAPAEERQPAAAPQCLSEVPERRGRVVEEHDAEVAQHQVERPGRERVNLGVGNLEPGVGDASGGGQPARFGQLDLRQVSAQGLPAAGGPGREDGHVTAAASDVKNVVRVLDLPGREQPRRQPAPHSLVPLALLGEVPPAGSVPGLGLLRIHRFIHD